jgi:copper(I)-binding protein
VNRWTRRRAASSRSVLAALALVGGAALVGCGAGQQAQTAEQRPTIDGQNASVGALALRDVAVDYPSAGVYKKGDDARLRLVIANDGDSSDALVEVRTDAAEEVTLGAAPAGGVTGSATPTPAEGSAEPSSTPTGTASGTPTGSVEPQTPSATAGSGQPSGSPTTEPSSSDSPAPSPTASETPSEAPAATAIPITPNGLVTFQGEGGPTITLSGLTRQLRPAETLQVTFVFRSAGSVTLEIAVSNPDGEISLAPTVTTAEDGSEG